MIADLHKLIRTTIEEEEKVFPSFFRSLTHQERRQLFKKREIEKTQKKIYIQYVNIESIIDMLPTVLLN